MNKALVLEDLVYLGQQSTFVFANPYLVFGDSERKAMKSLQTVSLQNFFCIKGEISVISVYLTFILLNERYARANISFDLSQKLT